MKSFIVILLVSFAFMGGYTINSFVFAQNTTTTNAPVVTSIDSLLVSITSIVIAIAGLVGVLVKAGLIDKRVGTVAVMAADASWAVKDNRQSIKDLSQNTYDVVKLASPETAEAADKKLAPVLDQATTRLNEYTPKVDKFAEIAKKMSEGKQADSIEEIKEDIPDKIVPS